MKGEVKTKEQLEKELTKLRLRISEMEKSEAKHKRADRALYESERQLCTLIEAIPDVIYFKDIKRKNVVVNKAYEKLVGLEREKILGKTDEELLPPALAKQCRKSDKEVLKKREPVHVEEQMTDREGKKIFFDTIKFPFKDAQGNVKGLVGVSRDITEHKKREEMLRQREERFKELWDNAPVAYHTLDAKGIITSVNLTEAKMLGYTQKEMVGRSVFEFVLPGQRLEARKRFRKKISGQHIPRAESRIYVRKDGSKIYVAIDDRLERDSNGKVIGIWTTMIDVTDRKQTEEALQESEKKYRTLVDNAPVGVYRSTLKGDLLYVNKALLKLAGFDSIEEMNSVGLVNLYKSSKERENFIKRLKQTGKVDNLELELFTKTKNINHVLLNAVLEGDVLSGMIVDISDRKQAEKVLQKSEERYRLLAENAQDIIYHIRLVPSREFEYVSPASTAIVGYTPEEHYSDPDLGFKLVHPDDRHLLENLAQGDISSGNPLIIRWIHKNGKIIWTEQHNVPIYDESGNLVAIEGIARDITDRKRAEDALKASLTEKEVLLREIHHRVKNNMQIISSLLRLQSKSIKDEKMLEKFKAGQTRIKSMALIHESLYRSKDLAKIDFSDYVRRLTTHLFSMYGVRKEAIDFNMAIKDVYLDITRAIPCGLIISELVSNSLKHAFLEDKSGKIVIEGHRDKRGKYTLIVDDTGVGFPKELDLQKTETLGMQLVTDLVKQIGGSIHLDRKGGTTFKITF